MDFRLPSLGEGIDSGTVSRVLVKVGDTIKPDQAVLVIETDKASMDANADVGGVVEAILVKPGDKIAVGAPVFRLGGTAAPAPATAAVPAPAPAPVPLPATAPAPVAAAGTPKTIEFKFSSLGEGIDSGTLSRVLVKVGDMVKAEQTVLVVETDKASMEVPIDFAGTIQAIHVKPGDKLTVGAQLFTVTTTTAAPVAAPAPVAAAAPAVASNGSHVAAKAPAAVAAPASTNGSHSKKDQKDYTPAGPATRRLARELGVALAEVPSSGRQGRVTLDDIKRFVKSERTTKKPTNTSALSGATVADSFTHPPLPDFSKFGEIEKKPASGIRMAIAKNLTISVRTIPSVTQNDIADITDLEAGRKRIVENLPKGAPKITWTVLAVKAVVAVLKEFPHFNSSFDMNNGELILKKYFNIGIAVDTERGLVVPVIRDADKKSIRDIAIDVASIADKARTGKLTLDEMRGGTFTITNLGGIGGTSFTPIVNYPEVAILGLSKSTLQPVVKDGAIVPRLMMPMSLTYDHRVIDGADGARFTTRLAQLFSDPIRLLMES